MNLVTVIALFVGVIGILCFLAHWQFRKSDDGEKFENILGIVAIGCFVFSSGMFLANIINTLTVVTPIMPSAPPIQL